MVTMETERLIVRNFRVEDWRDLYEYLSQEEVLRYEPEGPSTEDECKAKAIARSTGKAFWAVCLKGEGKMIGHVYFAQTEPLEWKTWEIGYIFNPRFYGKGYATEACRRILQHGFEELGAHRVIANCNPDNTPSWRLLERLAMRREGHYLKNVSFRTNADGEPIWNDGYSYAILQEEWRS